MTGKKIKKTRKNFIDMNIVYIIGNGFDLNLGLETSYKDFYDYIKGLPSDDELVDKIKKDICPNHEKWQDLEIALGEYTTEFNSTDDFEKVYFKISDKLKEFIRLKEAKLKTSEERKQKLCNDLITPEYYLLNTDIRLVTDYYSNWRNLSEWKINIINFNYTKTMEKLLDFRGNQIIGKNIFKNDVKLSKITHIHGVAEKDETILLGVNDKFQILNESFRDDIDFIDLIVKPQTNKELKTGIDSECIRWLKAANLICIFGSSIGETDNIWWELLGEQLKKNDCRVIHFFHEKEKIPKDRKQLIPKKIREGKSNILSKTNLDPVMKSHVIDKIWVAHNTDMFKLEKI